MYNGKKEFLHFVDVKIEKQELHSCKSAISIGNLIINDSSI